MEDTALYFELLFPGEKNNAVWKMLCLQVQAKQPIHENFWAEPSNQASLGHDVMEFEDGSTDRRTLAASTENASK